MWHEKVDEYFKETRFILNRVQNDEVKPTQKQRYDPVYYQISTD